MSLSQRKERRGRYRKLIRIVAYNSGYISPVAGEETVKRICVTQLGWDRDTFSSHLRATVENDDLVRGSGFLWSPEESGDFADAIEFVVEQADNPREFVAHMNQHPQ